MRQPAAVMLEMLSCTDWKVFFLYFVRAARGGMGVQVCPCVWALEMEITRILAVRLVWKGMTNFIFAAN